MLREVLIMILKPLKLNCFIKQFKLEEIVSMYLDYAENQAKKKILMKMNDWIQKLDSFLSFNEYGVLKDAGKVSAEVAKQLALKEYSKFSIIQDKTYISDFDLLIKESESSNQL